PGGEHWRRIFIVVGAFGGVWLLLWLVFIRGERAREIEHADVSAIPSAESEQSVPFWEVPLGRRVWGGVMVSLTVNGCLDLFCAWLPRILKKDLGYTEQEMLWMLVCFFVAADLGCLLAGYGTRRLTLAGFSVERSRKLVSLGTSLLCLLAIPLTLKPAAWL